jgi:Leucine-rich repeat (LRR) protein
MLLNKEILFGIYNSTVVQRFPFWTFTGAVSGDNILNFSATYTSNNIANVSWGDGTINPISSNVVYNYSFVSSSTGISLLPVDSQRNRIFTKIVCGITVPTLSGTIDVSPYTNLDFFSCSFNDLENFIGSEGILNLKELYLNYNQLSGTIPNLSNNISLQRFECYNNKFTDFNGSVSNTLGEFRADSNLLTTSAVDAILSAFVQANRTSGVRSLNLGGTGNASPSPAGILNRNFLVGSLGWTVVIVN